jgi:hypothetical protein
MSVVLISSSREKRETYEKTICSFLLVQSYNITINFLLVFLLLAVFNK